jgi:hypothetical protein
MAALAPSATRSVYSDKARSREFTITTSGRHHEIEIVGGDLVATVDDSRPLTIFVLDVSGSMFDSGDERNGYAGSRIWAVMDEMTKVAKRALAQENAVELVLWAHDSAYHQVTLANVDTVFRQSVNIGAIAQRIHYRRNAPNEFKDLVWHGSTLPRLGFDRVQEVVELYRSKRAGRTTTVSNITMLFATDGEFTKDHPKRPLSPSQDLTDSFLRDLGKWLVDINIPVGMTYLGIIRDNVPDAQRILSVFPKTRYFYIEKASELRTKTDTIIEALETRIAGNMAYFKVYNIIGAPDRADSQTSIDRRLIQVSELGHYMFADDVVPVDAELTSTVEVTGESQIRMLHIREKITAAVTTLDHLKDEHTRGVAIVDRLLEVDATLAAIRKTIEKEPRSSALNRTRMYHHSAARYKNAMQQFAAQQVHRDDLKNARLILSKQQDLVMACEDKYSISLAKQITRNSAKRREYTVSGPACQNDETGEFTTFTIQVDFAAPPGGQPDVKRFTTAIVPQRVAFDEEIDPITAESWAEIYRSADTRGQAFLIEKPNESAYHAPSRSKVKPALLNTAIQTFYDAVEQRVEVDGYDSIFTRPFKGMSADDTYNLVLPTYAPNLEYVAKFTLKRLLGYIIAGHEMAYPSRILDIYIPCIMSLWNRYAQQRDTKTLREAMLLTHAFRQIKKWTGLGSLHDPGVKTVEGALRQFVTGDSGTHNFMSLSEPLIYYLMTGGNPTVTKTAEDGTVTTTPIVEGPETYQSRFRHTMLAEKIFKIAHGRGDALYREHLVPMIKEIITETDLMNTERFPDGAPVDGLGNAQVPVWQGTERLDALRQKFMGNFTTRGADSLMLMAEVLTPEVWEHVDTHYDVPADLNDRIKAHFQAKQPWVAPLREVIPLIAIANDFPSNSTRRALFSDASKSLGQRAREVFANRVKQTLDCEMGDIRREAVYQARLERIKPTHEGLPIICTPANENWINTIATMTEEQWISGFRRRFDKQLVKEAELFRLPLARYMELLDINLRRIWAERANLGQVATSSTGMFYYRCGHALCPEFLNKQADMLENGHLRGLGGDLPRQNKFRMWVPGMHLEMSRYVHRPKEEFMSHMREYGSRFSGEAFVPHLVEYYSWHWENFQ